MIPNSPATSMSPSTAYKNVRWRDLVNLTPEEAVSVMAVKLGRPILAADAASALHRARARSRFHASAVLEVVANFQRDSIGKRLGNSTGTTDTYKLIIQQRDRFASADANRRFQEQLPICEAA